MENKIYHIAKDELSSIKQQLNSQGYTWIAEIDGNKISTWENYADAIENAFRFPAYIIEMHVHGMSIDGYLDWIRDLGWLDSSAYAIVINNYRSFMSDDPQKKDIVLKSFEDCVLPWWQSEVEQYQVEGKAKQFNVYLVD